jgi:hypothetical protein
MTVTSWSYSKLGDFEQCKKRFWLKHDQRIPEPQRPLPAGKTEHANDRGTRVHQSCEDFVCGKTDELALEAEKYFGHQLTDLRVLYEDGMVSLEGEWGHNDDWGVYPWGGQWERLEADQVKMFVDEYGFELAPKVKELPPRGRGSLIYQKGKEAFIWQDPWLRLKVDAIVFHDETTATVIDYKTGRKFGNEMKHSEQLQLYQLSTFLRYPKLELVHAELWYLDQDEVTSQQYTRPMGLRFRDKFTKRGDALLSCSAFPPNPNKFTCKWCMYGPWGSGDCTVGVKG